MSLFALFNAFRRVYFLCLVTKLAQANKMSMYVSVWWRGGKMHQTWDENLNWLDGHTVVWTKDTIRCMLDSLHKDTCIFFANIESSPHRCIMVSHHDIIWRSILEFVHMIIWLCIFMLEIPQQQKCIEFSEEKNDVLQIF